MFYKKEICTAVKPEQPCSNEYCLKMRNSSDIDTATAMNECQIARVTKMLNEYDLNNELKLLE